MTSRPWRLFPAILLAVAGLVVFRGGHLVLPSPWDCCALGGVAALTGNLAGWFLRSLDQDPLPLWLAVLVSGGMVFVFMAHGQASGGWTIPAVLLAYGTGLALRGYPAGFAV